MSRHTGYTHLPLHPGRAPAWLFARMTRLAREIAVSIVADRGPAELLRRLSDPFWFQAFGCVLGFDWHSSGVTTTSTGALKEGIRNIEHDLGVYALGGKGATSRKTPTEILDRCERLAVDPGPLLYASRMAANVDSAALQDGYQLCHHSFFFSGTGQWCVVQQGMSIGEFRQQAARSDLLRDFDPRHLHTVLLSTYERAPKDFETLLGLQGAGARWPTPRSIDPIGWMRSSA